MSGLHGSPQSTSPLYTSRPASSPPVGTDPDLMPISDGLRITNTKGEQGVGCYVIYSISKFQVKTKKAGTSWYTYSGQ